jgi:hypothetical protein
MSGQKLHVRTEFHQVMYLTMTVWMEQDQIVQVVTTPFTAFYDMVSMNAGFTIEPLTAHRAITALMLAEAP